jgi:hypothetical protein
LTQDNVSMDDEEKMSNQLQKGFLNKELNKVYLIQNFSLKFNLFVLVHNA